MKIGIWARQENLTWVAGSIFQANLIASLRMIDEDVSVCLLVKRRTAPPPIPAEWSRNLDVVELPGNVSLLERGLARLRQTLPLRNRRLDACLSSAGVDIVFGNLLRQGPLDTPWLAWITDFQYLHFPENFSPEEVRYRKEVALETVKNAARTLLNGPCVFADFKQIAP